MITRITMDGKLYRVRIVYDTMQLAFELKEGPNATTMLSGREERDLQGTAYGHQMQVEPDPAYPQDFDDFFDAISAPVDSHTVVMPFGNGTIEYGAMIKSGNMTYAGVMGGRKRWKNLTVNYKPIEPQRVPED